MKAVGSGDSDQGDSQPHPTILGDSFQAAIVSSTIFSRLAQTVDFRLAWG
jgi:hypothetical protein